SADQAGVRTESVAAPWRFAFLCFGIENLQSLVSCGALNRDAPGTSNPGADFGGMEELSKSRARGSGNTLVHEGPAEIVRARAEPSLCEFRCLFHPTRLEVGNRAIQHQARDCIEAQHVIVCDGSKVGEQPILDHGSFGGNEAERYELGEAARLFLNRADQI